VEEEEEEEEEEEVVVVDRGIEGARKIVAIPRAFSIT
jgi:hypothetical protein